MQTTIVSPLIKRILSSFDITGRHLALWIFVHVSILLDIVLVREKKLISWYSSVISYVTHITVEEIKLASTLFEKSFLLLFKTVC